MIYPRWLAQLLAWFGGYFWLSCPVCGENFAGFESSNVAVERNGSYWCTCSKQECIAAGYDEGNKRLRELYATIPQATTLRAREK